MQWMIPYRRLLMMKNNAENNVIDIYPYFQGGSYTKENKCKCGCGMSLDDMKNSEYYDYENNLEEE